MNEVASCEELVRQQVARRRVAIVGSGPGGLVVARYLKHHGFEPVLFEQDDDIGGAVERSFSSQWRLAFDGNQHKPLANLLQRSRFRTGGCDISIQQGDPCVFEALCTEIRYRFTGSLLYPRGANREQSPRRWMASAI